MKGKACLQGPFRLSAYLAYQLCVLALPPWVLPALALGLAIAWRVEAPKARPAGPRGKAGLRHLPLLLVILSPALVSAPTVAENLRTFMSAWLPGLARSARLALVFWSASWLSRGMSPVELRDALLPALKVCGPRAQASIARAVSLMLAFFPWTISELKRADEAARLRGSDPKRRPGYHIAALAIPVSVRSLEKARRSAEALSLRDAGLA